MNNNPIGIFDSGVGGLFVLEKCRAGLPREKFIYAVDGTSAPYGNKSDAYIRDRAKILSVELVKRKCKAIVIACNTASAVALDVVKNACRIPVIGVFPAIRQAARSSAKGKTLVLCTVATARQKVVKAAIEKCGSDRIILAPQPDLAQKIERNFDHIERISGGVIDMLCCYKNVSAVVLGCTHYTAIKPLVSSFYGDGVRVFDSSDGVAKRLFRLLKTKKLLSDGDGSVKYIYL